MFRNPAIDIVLVVAMAGIAVGRIPRLRMNRPGMALAAATFLVGLGALTPAAAFAAVDIGTIALLLAMMLVVANLRMAGFFQVAGGRILAVAKGPKTLLALVVASSGLLSAFFLNDTICIVFTPLVAEMTRRARRDPLPYLIAVAVSANVGSEATIIGNPQNMLIGASSGIPFAEFTARLAPPAIVGLIVAWAVIVLSQPAEFRSGGRAMLAPMDETRVEVDRRLIAKSLLAAALMLGLLLVGVDPAIAALSAASILLVTRRVDPDRVFAFVDFGLLVFFAGLFVMTKAIEGRGGYEYVAKTLVPMVAGAGGALPVAPLAGLVAILSNLVSNVPAVMLFRPLMGSFADPHAAWLVLAMASTFAGNLTLLGSVANLIVAEGAKRSGIDLSFGRYLRVGLPVTVITIAMGATWIALT
ncbi:MAG TPA: anion transporter [Rectinemataceae bacterium]|nr:anion transporter [Rectinemataceae bacterium]